MHHWFRCGEVVAAKAVAPDGGDGVVMALRDDGGVDQIILVVGRMPRPDHSGYLTDWSVVLEALPTGSDPPRPDVRAAHQRVVAERTAMRRRTYGDKAGAKATEQGAALTVGSPTAAYASGAARSLLMRAVQGKDEREFMSTFFRNGYFVLDRALAGDTEDFIKDLALVDNQVPGQSAAADTQAGPWSRSPARRTVWLDEEVAKSRYGAPAVSNAIALLKGMADALNPILSRHRADRAAEGDPAYTSPPVAPAAPEAVLTVPPEALVASYPGGGCRLAAHVDNSYSPETGSRWNARELTAIIYATPPDWDTERDGGALKIYPHSTDSQWDESRAVCIDPLGGRLVVFFSCFRHEVLPASRTRRAMQLWIFRPDQAISNQGPTGGNEDMVPAKPKPSPKRTWRVSPCHVGGLLVRSGPGSSWKMHTTMLLGGARLEQIEEAGDWLHFRKISGDGPEVGWVTTKAKNGARLVEREGAA